VMSTLVLHQGRKKKNAYTKAKSMEAERAQCKTRICLVGNRYKNEVFEADKVESKWNAMKEVWQKATEQVCGWTKGPPRHSEAWCCNDEVAKAIEEKRRCYKVWHKTKTASDRNKYKEARRNARSVAVAQEKTRQELINELQSTTGKKNVYRIAKQMAKSRQDAVGVNCVKDAKGKVLVENDQVKEE